jgi:hypothetical protein
MWGQSNLQSRSLPTAFKDKDNYIHTNPEHVSERGSSWLQRGRIIYTSLRGAYKREGILALFCGSSSLGWNVRHFTTNMPLCFVVNQTAECLCQQPIGFALYLLLLRLSRVFPLAPSRTLLRCTTYLIYALKKCASILVSQKHLSGC